MSTGHGHRGPIREVVEVLSGWVTCRGHAYTRKVRLVCGHVVSQSSGHIKFADHKRTPNIHVHCHICLMKATQKDAE